MFPRENNPFAYDGELNQYPKNDNKMKLMNDLTTYPKNDNKMNDSTITNYSEFLEFIQENIGIPLPIVPKKENPLKKDGKPLFNGKNPSYYKNGKSTLIYHSEINSFDEVKEYFNTDLELNIGTKITKDNICVIDIDCKEVPELKNEVYQKLLEYKPELKNGYVEQTANKGYHLIVKAQETSTYFPFTVKGFEQYKIGEILRCGRFVVNAPSSGYELISGNPPLEIESLASIGIIKYEKKEHYQACTVASIHI